MSQLFRSRSGSVRLVLEVLEDRSLPSAALNAAGGTHIIPPANHAATIASEFNPQEIGIDKPATADHVRHAESEPSAPIVALATIGAHGAEFNIAPEGLVKLVGAIDRQGNGGSSMALFVMESVTEAGFGSGNDTSKLVDHTSDPANGDGPGSDLGSDPATGFEGDGAHGTRGILRLFDLGGSGDTTTGQGFTGGGVSNAGQGFTGGSGVSNAGQGFTGGSGVSNAGQGFTGGSGVSNAGQGFTGGSGTGSDDGDSGDDDYRSEHRPPLLG